MSMAAVVGVQRFAAEPPLRGDGFVLQHHAAASGYPDPVALLRSQFPGIADLLFVTL